MSILDLFKLDGKVALVTGSNQGLGQSMAIALAEAGADIIGLDRNDASQATCEAVESTGRKFEHLVCDLRSTPVEEMRAMVGSAAQRNGHIDILVNNAGIIRRAPALEFSEGDWDDVLQINLKAAFFLSQIVGNLMVKQGGGKIINVASMLSFQGGIIVPSYTAAKSGIAGITRALANEWAKYQINVNAIAPGYMATENTAPLRADANRSVTILDRIPAGRWGEPTDLRGAVVFLASAASDYMTGAIVPVDGGWMAR